MGVCLFYGFLFYALTNFSLPFPGKAPVIYSNQAGDDLKKVYLSALQRAKQTIFFEIYSLSDGDILHMLNKKSEEGVSTSIRYDPNATHELEKKLRANIQTTPAHTTGLMHRKILVIDHHLVLMGSANMTRASLSHHDNIVVGIDDKTLSENIEQNKNFPFEFFLEGQKISLYLLPDKNQVALNKLLSCIETAKKCVHVAMFTLTHPTLTEALIKAHQKGVDVQVALDVTTSEGASRLSKEKLEQAGVRVILSHGKQLFHHKWTAIDEEVLIMGSANWTKAAFKKNEDFLLIIENLQPLQKQKIEKIWQKIITENTLEKKVA